MNREKQIEQVEKILRESTNYQFDPDNYNTGNYDAIHDSSFGLVAEKIVDNFANVIDGWAKVKDMLPDKDMECWIFLKKPRIRKKAWYYRDNDEFFTLNASDITHWMPYIIPPKPK